MIVYIGKDEGLKRRSQSQSASKSRPSSLSGVGRPERQYNTPVFYGGGVSLPGSLREGGEGGEEGGRRVGEVHEIVGRSTRNGKYHLRCGKYRCRVSVVMGLSNGLGDGNGDGDGKEFERGVQVPLCRIYYGGVHEI